MTSPERAGSAYFIATPDKGPAVLVLHLWWGLTTWARERADELADAGYSVLVPDLLAGARPETSAEAELVLGAADMDTMAGLVRSSVHHIQAYSADPSAPVACVGFGMGASWALWASVRQPALVRSVVACYGTQDIDFDGALARYQLHLAGEDEVVTQDEAAHTRALLGLAGLDVETHVYEGMGHAFAEPESPRYDPAASATMWGRVREFLAEHAPTT